MECVRPGTMACDRHDLAHALPWLTLRMDFDNGRALGPAEVRLMKLMWETGFISAAGRTMGLSYCRAWLLMDALNRMCRQAVAIARDGDAGVGGALATRCGGMTAAAALRQGLRVSVDGMAPPDGWGTLSCNRHDLARRRDAKGAGPQH